MKEEELLTVLKTRNTAGLGILYQMYSRAMLIVIMRLVKDKPTAEDTLQMVWLKVWSEVRNYDPDKGRIYTWLISIARNAAIDTYRSKDYKNFRKNAGFEYFEESREEFIAEACNQDVIDLRQLVAQLEEKERKVVQLIYFQGFTQVEVAEHLEMPLGTVKTRVKYALKNLRQLYDEDGAKASSAKPIVRKQQDNEEEQEQVSIRNEVNRLYQLKTMGMTEIAKSLGIKISRAYSYVKDLPKNGSLSKRKVDLCLLPTAKPLKPAVYEMAVKIKELDDLKTMTQAQIGAQLGITSLKVSRYLFALKRWEAAQKETNKPNITS